MPITLKTGEKAVHVHGTARKHLVRLGQYSYWVIELTCDHVDLSTVGLTDPVNTWPFHVEIEISRVFASERTGLRPGWWVNETHNPGDAPYPSLARALSVARLIALGKL